MAGMNGWMGQGFPTQGYGGGYQQDYYGGGGGYQQPSIASSLNNMLLGGYQGYGNAINGAMNQMMLMNLANQNASINQRAIEAPIYQEQIRADAAKDISNNRMSQLSPLLQALAGSLGTTAFGNSGGMGFSAVGADGKPFASATQGGSNAPASDASQFRPQTAVTPQRRGFTQQTPGMRRIGR
jgi:hypothetical protein